MLSSGNAKKEGYICALKQLADQGRQSHKELNVIQCAKCYRLKIGNEGWKGRGGRGNKPSRGAITFNQQEENPSGGVIYDLNLELVPRT